MIEPTREKATPEKLEEEVMNLLDEAAAMEVGLKDDDSPYDLTYISETLRKLGIFQERLSDIQMKLTRMGIEITKVSRQKTSLYKFKEKELRGSPDYHNTPLAEKALWLANQLGKVTEDVESWRSLTFVVSAVKDAVSDRVATMKRLDSDIRLHAKIFEAKVSAGATSPSSYTGTSTTEIDI